jgi:hypothetical protein
MAEKAKSVKEYLARLTEDRRLALESVRKVMLKHMPAGYEEGVQYGMIVFHVPHSIYPAGYHCDRKIALPFVGMASQKNYMSVYLNCLYSDPEHEAWFKHAWARTGKKLDMGKSCIRFKRVEDLALEVIGEAIARVPVERHIEKYEDAIKGLKKKKR